jgi:hypothetical protein
MDRYHHRRQAELRWATMKRKEINVDKKPIFIACGGDIARVNFGNAKSYLSPQLQIISPSYTDGETGGFTPSQDVKVVNIAHLIEIRDAMNVAIAEYTEGRLLCDKETK